MRRVACLVIFLAGAAVAAAQPVPPRQRPDRPWTVSVVTGLPSREALDDLERAMNDSRLNAQLGACFFDFCLGGVPTPRSNRSRPLRDTWTATVNRRVSGRFGVSLTGGATRIGTTNGDDAATRAFLAVEPTMAHVAALATFTLVPGLRVGAGPGLFTTTFTVYGSGRPQRDEITTRRPGALAEASVTLPPRSRIFVELSAQERWLGREQLGPFDVVPDGSAVFEQADVRMAHWFIGLGFGLRF